MRRVLGASVGGIVIMLNKDFLKLVFIGFIIAVPITWYMTTQWLQNFSDRIEIGPGVFVLTRLPAFLVTLLTVSWQSIKAAVANPVDSLKNE